MSISLNRVKMNVVVTAPNGVVNRDTIFKFVQQNDVVFADYKGGQIRKGFLVGRSDGFKVTFSYCQLQLDQSQDTGESIGYLSQDGNGAIVLTEHFEWTTRPGEFGRNVLREIKIDIPVAVL